MSTQNEMEFVTIETNYRSTRDNSAWGLEHYFTYKPEILLPLIQGYEVHEGNLVVQKEEIYSANISDIIGKNTETNVTNVLDCEN